MASVKRSNQKNLLYLIVGIIVLVGIGGAVYLSQQTQIFKSRASWDANLVASCSRGTIYMHWPTVGMTSSYKIRGGRNMIGRPSNDAWNSFPNSEKIIDDVVINCSTGSCNYSTTERAGGAPIQQGDNYYLWVHSVDLYGHAREPMETSVVCDY